MSRKDHWLALLLVAVVALIYAPTAHFGYITLDDRVFHIEPPELHGGINAHTLKWALTDTAGNYWHPTWNLVNLVAFTAFGPRPGPQHVVNTVLYGAMSAGLFYTLRDRKRSEEHTSELQSLAYLVCRLLLEKKKEHAQ